VVSREAPKEREPAFAGMYWGVGPCSIPPEQLLKACLLMAFCSMGEDGQVSLAEAIISGRDAR